MYNYKKIAFVIALATSCILWSLNVEASGLDTAKKIQDSQLSKKETQAKLAEEHKKIKANFFNRLYPVGYQVYLDAKKAGLALQPIKPLIDEQNYRAKSTYGEQNWINKSLDDGYFGVIENLDYEKSIVFAIKSYGLVDIRGSINNAHFGNSDTARMPKKCQYFIDLGMQGKLLSCKYMLDPKNKQALVSIVEKLLTKDMQYTANEKPN